jgi:hypothetical protein
MISDWCRQEANAADIRSLPASPDAAPAGSLKRLAGIVFGRWADVVLRNSLTPAPRMGVTPSSENV